MNSINFFKNLGLSMVAVLAISSCVKENVEPMANGSQDLMTISLSTAIQTKTAMTPGVPKLSWTEGDKFDLFSNGGDAKTTPEYTTDDAAIEAGVNQGATEVYAVYPAVAANTKSSVEVTIPAAQTQAVAGKMNGSNVPMYARGVIEDGAAVLSFKPVAGIFALNIYSTEATEAKVKKVQINPLDAEGNFIYEGYCGTATAAADDFDYVPTIEDPTKDYLKGVTLTLGTPCEIASEKPADNAATLNFANQLYIAVARGTYAGLQFIITTDDGKMYVAKTTTARSFETTDVHYLNINLAGKDEISDDFYGQYNAGLDLTICGNVINKKTHPKAQLKTMAALSWEVLAKSYADETDGGILFIDNDPDVQTYKASGNSNRVIGENRIIIGRYRNAAQPMFRYTVAGNISWAMSGKVMVKNVNFSLFQSASGRPLIIGTTNYGDGKSEFYFADCTLVSVGGKGIFACNASTWSVPKSMMFDNCILRADAPFFNTSESNPEATTQSIVFNKMKALENMTFNNCVFAPVSSASPQNATIDATVSPLNVDGVLVNLYRPSGADFSHKLDNLNISFKYCSFYNLGPAKSTVAMVRVTSMKSTHFEYCLFSNSDWVNNAYLLKVPETCPSGATYSGKAVYTDQNGTTDKHYLAVGSATEFTNVGISRTLSITNKKSAVIFDAYQSAKHYFPKASTFTENGGASYDTKYWVVPTPAAN